jgi:hypothetical protein
VRIRENLMGSHDVNVSPQTLKAQGAIGGKTK